jgi:hypothetical protein
MLGALAPRKLRSLRLEVRGQRLRAKAPERLNGVNTLIYTFLEHVDRAPVSRIKFPVKAVKLGGGSSFLIYKHSG